MLTVKRTIGDTEITYTADGKDLKEDILKASWLTTAPTECPLCTANIVLQGRITKEGEYMYAEFRCKNCRVTAQFGEYKNPKGAFFVKKFANYEPTIQVDEK